MAKKTKPAPKLEGEALLEHIGQEAIARCLMPMKAKAETLDEGYSCCGFRFQEEVFIGKLAFDKVEGAVRVNLKVFSLNPQNGSQDLRLDHDFQEGV